MRELCGTVPLVLVVRRVFDILHLPCDDRGEQNHSCGPGDGLIDLIYVVCLRQVLH